MLSACGRLGLNVISATYILIDMGACGIHHDVAGDVGLHALRHEHTRALLLVVSVPDVIPT